MCQRRMSVKGGALESKQRPDERHAGEIDKCQFGIINEMPGDRDACFGQVIGSQVFDIAGGQGGLFNPLRHCRWRKRTAYRVVSARTPA